MFSLLFSRLLWFWKNITMTFKTETNCKDDKNDSATQTVTVTNERISTIYDPRQRCSPIPSFTASFSGQHPADGADKKKSLMEKIKKITFNLRLKKCRFGNDYEINTRKIKLLCYSTLIISTITLMLTSFIYFLTSGKKNFFDRNCQIEILKLIRCFFGFFTLQFKNLRLEIL